MPNKKGWESQGLFGKSFLQFLSIELEYLSSNWFAKSYCLLEEMDRKFSTGMHGQNLIQRDFEDQNEVARRGQFIFARWKSEKTFAGMMNNRNGRKGVLHRQIGIEHR